MGRVQQGLAVLASRDAPPPPQPAHGGAAEVQLRGLGRAPAPDASSPALSVPQQNLGWTLMEDGSIRIEEATEEALGTYTCVPYNTLGTMGQSSPARLVLKVRLGLRAASVRALGA